MAVSTGLIPTSFRTVRPPMTQPTVYPAPIGGMDARVPMAIDALDSCLWAINMVPTEYAMRVRKGYRQWMAQTAEEIRTVVPYFGSTASGSADKFFVVTEDGIYDATDGDGTAPTLKVAFSTQSTDAGWGVYTSYVDESGDDMMFLADRENGLFRYDPVAETWTQATGIQAKSGSIGTLDVTDIAFVVVHKLRIWLIEKDANKAWYLPIRSATGDATEFFFGSKFRHGGELVGLYNWTIDGGLGRDDHLVAVSRGGDVIPWTGEDPSDGTTWSSTGVFYIGEVPAGSRVASEYGGELFLLSKYGLTSMSGMMRGAETSSMGDPSQIGHKIARLLRADLEDYGDDEGWGIQFVSSLGSILVTMPLRDDGRYRQYIYNIATRGWGMWRDVPILCADTWTGSLMLGDPDGWSYRMDVDNENQTAAGVTGDAIQWFVLTNYSHLGSPAVYKQCKFIRPNFLTDADPVFVVYAYYDYRTSEVAGSGSSGTPDTGSLWDTGLWDDAIWGFEFPEPHNQLLGGSGIGRSVAIALYGSSASQTDLASVDVMWETGGLM